MYFPIGDVEALSNCRTSNDDPWALKILEPSKDVGSGIFFPFISFAISFMTTSLPDGVLYKRKLLGYKLDWASKSHVMSFIAFFICCYYFMTIQAAYKLPGTVDLPLTLTHPVLLDKWVGIEMNWHLCGNYRKVQQVSDLIINLKAWRRSLSGDAFHGNSKTKLQSWEAGLPCFLQVR